MALGVFVTNPMIEPDPNSLKWTPEAKAKFKNIPFFARTQARERIEHLAREADLDTVTAEIVEQARLEFGQ
ncbi:MAG: PCP reductase family protein [Leptodesmis sp.]|uniref:PCP reductase family protein n=2 Tax=Leptodesmis TaxID=2664261 RepID=UPI003D0F865E